MYERSFSDLLTTVEKAVVHNFLGHHKLENHVQLIEDLMTNFAAMDCKMSLKLHVLASHLDKFKSNLGAYSEEHGERFHQDIKNFEHRFQGEHYR